MLNAVAEGDLSQKMAGRIDGRPIEGEFLHIRGTVNAMVDRLSSLADEVTRVAREVGTEGKLGGQARVKDVSGVWKDLAENVNSMASNLTAQVRDIAEVTTSVANGDLSKKITADVRGEVLQLKDTVNTMVDQLSSFADEVTRVAREVGTEGNLGGQANVEGVSGLWKDLTDNVNVMASNLTDQVRNVAQVTTAVANGDLSQKITADVRGEVLQLKDTINIMVDQLRSFAAEVTRVSGEVGTEGKLGGQASVEGVSGVWKDLTDNVNLMASNLTSQVRNIAQVTTAVAKGDLSQEITVDARGEFLELKDTVNTMVDQLSSFAEEVNRVAREVGTEGKLGGQANVEDVSGVWKDLTDNVNSMALSLTSQVREMAAVSAAVTRGDLTRSIEVEAQGEVAALKDTINQMIANLREEIRRQAEILRERELERARRDAERHRHRRAVVLDSIAAALERRTDVAGRADQLARSCVEGFADFALVEIGGDGISPTVAIACTQPGNADELRELVRLSVPRPAPGEPEVGIRAERQLTRDEWFALVPGILGERAWEQLLPATALVAPLRLGGRRLGRLTLARTRESGPYDAEELELAAELPKRAAMAIENSRLYELERERSRTLQLSLLDLSPLAHPTLTAATRYIAGSTDLEVGGDWLEVVERDDGNVVVIVGDVVGRGLRAATAMGKLRSAIGALAHVTDDPARMLERLDRFATRVAGAELATVVCAVVAPEAGTLTYSSAGHIPGLHVSGDGKPSFLEAGRGFPLGIDPSAPRPQGRERLGAGSMLLFFTDGLVEAPGQPLDAGLERLAAVASTNAEDDPELVCDKVIGEFVDRPRDDVALACVRLSGRGADFHTLRFPAVADQLAPARHAFGRWLREREVSETAVGELVQAFDEACSNAVRHAYQNGDGTVSVRLTHESGVLTIHVSDTGRWAEPRISQGNDGRGLAIIRALVDRSDVHGTPHGTTIVMQKRVATASDRQLRRNGAGTAAKRVR